VDNLTHSLFALTLANTRLRRAGGGTTAALLLASNAPDMELVTLFTGGRLGYLAAHRGPTHGPLGWIGLSLATAALVRFWPRRQRADPRRVSFLPLVAVSAVGVACHILMDFATSYGTRVLSPFAETWYGVDWLPIVDIYLLAILGFGLVLARARPAARTRVAIAALLAAGGYYALRAGAHEAAISRALDEDRAARFGQVESSAQGDMRRPGLVFHYLWPAERPELPAALPTFLSPFRWRILHQIGRQYETHEIDLLVRGETREASARPLSPGMVHPGAVDHWVELASAAPTARVFLAFARFPVLFVSRRPGGDVMVRWNDIRFAQPGRTTSPDGSHPASPFGAFVRLSPGGRVIRDGLGPG
jgi:membrane-bound metal-dependent hydrolase YbcI (DUF457 family)